jgi:Zn-dependent peptidase ImmA (M78 family)
MNRSVIASLRDFVPIKPLTREQALRVAELQATRFRVLTDQRRPLLPTEAIAELPRLQVERMSPLPVSGATAWSEGRWLILLRGSEPQGRQRFSLAHEFKHILDHRFIDVLYEGIPETVRHDFVEQVCDYFAGCLLVPRLVLRQQWAQGVTDVGELAARFGVSQPAMQTRMAQIGLSRPQARCSVQNPDWALRFIKSAGSSSASYMRSLHPAWREPVAAGEPT